jgi:peroxiredoxin
MQLTVGMTAPDFVLKDSTGREVSLSSLWQGGPTVLTFLRHFG